MISPTATPQYFGTSSSTSSTTSTTPGGSLDKDAFLKMLVAELKHQDPSNPMDGKDLAAQLAQFTSVEQLSQLNTGMTAQTQATQMNALINQSSLSASLIGKQVEATGNTLVVDGTTNPTIKVDIAGAGGTATLTLKDSSGNVVATRDLGTVSTGTGQTLKLPSDLPTGSWTYSLAVTNSSGAASTVTTYVTGIVTSVEFKNGSIVLHAGGADLLLDNLLRIEPAPTSTSSSSSSGSTGTGSTTGDTVTAGVENSIWHLLGRR